MISIIPTMPWFVPFATMATDCPFKINTYEWLSCMLSDLDGHVKINESNAVDIVKDACGKALSEDRFYDVNDGDTAIAINKLSFRVALLLNKHPKRPTSLVGQSLIYPVAWCRDA